jgi:mono/diheme cytochrome c family protein
MLKGVGFVWVATACVALSGCEKQSEPAAAPPAPKAEAAPAPATAAPPADARKQAEEVFATRCTPCHGSKGAGDGPASAGLTPKPRNFQDPAWQSSVTDDHIEKVISYGGAAVGKSPAMPPNPDLADKPVIPALRAYIRSLKP